MSSIHSTSTNPEMKLRKELWKRGYRYRTNDKRLPGTPDIVLPKYRSVIFVHGCFWHAHRGCKLYVVPKTNTQFWLDKVSRNHERDERVWRDLEAKGWFVIIIWECQLANKCFDDTVSRVENELLDNEESYRRNKEERARIREQQALERKLQKDRYRLHLSDIKR